MLFTVANVHHTLRIVSVCEFDCRYMIIFFISLHYSLFIF